MSARLRVEGSAYYETLEATHKGGLNITPPLSWFLAVLDRALSDAETTLGATIRKSRFWERLSGLPVNGRQHAMLSRLLEGFEGRLTTSKWAQITECSQDTALRDIADLMRRGVLVQDAAGGRSTSYRLAP